MSVSDLSAKLQRLALINVCLGQFMTALDSRSIIVALPTISIHFNSSMAVVQWIPLAYQLTIIGFVLSLARLGDIQGRKKIYGSGFLLLALGSVCSGLSTGLWQIIAFRVLAGVGGAMVLANGRAILSIVYAQQERGRALGLASMAFHLGYISGPSVAGVLIDTVGWRWIFFLNLPVALGVETLNDLETKIVSVVAGTGRRSSPSTSGFSCVACSDWRSSTMSVSRSSRPRGRRTGCAAPPAAGPRTGCPGATGSG